MAAAIAVPVLSPRESAFETARKNFQLATAHLGLSDELAMVLSTPHRELRLEIPVWSEEGALNAYIGYRIQHNATRGACVGGIEISSDFDRNTARALAEVMTWKAALLDIPFGGSSGGVACDLDRLTAREINDLSRRFVTRIHAVLGQFRDVLSPALDSPSQVVECLFRGASELHGFEPASFAGKPLEYGGLPGAPEAAGRGIAVLIRNAVNDLGINVPGFRFAIQGGNAVTRALTEALRKQGALQVACGASPDSYSAVASDCDVLVLADSKCVLHASNASSVRARLVVETSDLVVTPSADMLLRSMGVTVIPDLIANSAGGLCAYLEWSQNLEQVAWFQQYVDEWVENGMIRAYRAVCDYASRHNLPLRTAAYAMGIDRVACVEKLRAA